MKKTYKSTTYFSITILGCIYKLNIKYLKIDSIKIEKLEKEVNIILPKVYKDSNNEELINECIKKIYDSISKKEIENAMEFSRHIFYVAPEDYKIKRMQDCYYKYLKKTLYINPDIVQFNRDIIYTTIIKAFCKIKFKEGTKKYQIAIERALEEYDNLKNNELYIKAS